MANSRRVSRVSALIKREVGQLLFNGIKDDRVVGMVSVTDVDVSGDLQHVKIFVSIYGTEEVKMQTMEGLKASKGWVRRELGQRVRLRRTPEVVFIEDRALERGDRMIHLLEEIVGDSSSSNTEPETEGDRQPLVAEEIETDTEITPKT
ncbi:MULTISPECIES: 30S ribosome-binding factor RbfA [Spirulina sp. CCY15215]|uniref:30S ribosome-binding factor RbfA n=1 Tax=Spirulina sp. CCY15215 TaxID=2767591 RepID=UPI00195264B1|nr:30S ribosome-binding factor RbfA [Spirulina major]